MKSEGVVLDASALVALLWDEPGAGRVQEVLDRASRDDTRCAISAVNWGEVLYTAARHEGAAGVPAAIEKLDGLPLRVVDADRDLTVRAAMLKASGVLDYADAFAAALALTLGVPLLTSDRDFEALAAERGLDVEFIR